MWILFQPSAKYHRHDPTALLLPVVAPPHSPLISLMREDFFHIVKRSLHVRKSNPDMWIFLPLDERGLLADMKDFVQTNCPHIW